MITVELDAFVGMSTTTKYLPPGCTAMHETSRSLVSSFFISFSFSKSYTRTNFFVEMKKMDLDGWKAVETGSPCNLNGIFWLPFLDSWCIIIARDSRTEQVKKNTRINNICHTERSTDQILLKNADYRVMTKFQSEI